MAILLMRNFSRCQVRLQSGVDGEGNPIYATRVFGRIKPDTSDQDMYDVVQGIVGLQDLPVHTIRRLEDGELVEE
jgi:hypothetical protein